jgi:hypothetical protein
MNFIALLLNSYTQIIVSTILYLYALFFVKNIFQDKPYLQ